MLLLGLLAIWMSLGMLDCLCLLLLCLPLLEARRDLVVKWKAPPAGVYKVNSDAAIHADHQLVGVGFVIRNSDEASAILKGLRFITDCGLLLPAVLESDAKRVVDLVNSGCESNADIVDIVALSSDSSQFNIPISFVPGVANVAAHALAKFVLRSDVDRFWVEESPPCLESVILLDSIPLGGN
ncbi:hypothetical protein Dsin_014572 [Dipteronia sinensis]|uniref:RNase H type-1 domain-containing protein n=1 Tax=Dipteronia sinensis TaxID=43782 RepID=A0AAE0ANC0_9ROSI|nr:hypothetical protein Dsin_014572 [Dipteronia sinensis]